MKSNKSKPNERNNNNKKNPKSSARFFVMQSNFRACEVHIHIKCKCFNCIDEMFRNIQYTLCYNNFTLFFIIRWRTQKKNMYFCSQFRRNRCRKMSFILQRNRGTIFTSEKKWISKNRNRYSLAMQFLMYDWSEINWSVKRNHSLNDFQLFPVMNVDRNLFHLFIQWLRIEELLLWSALRE